jgi:hypothetical protein
LKPAQVRLVELGQKISQHRVDWYRRYERINTALEIPVYRDKVGEGPRLLFSYSNEEIRLLDIGPHDETYDSWRDTKRHSMPTRQFNRYSDLAALPTLLSDAFLKGLTGNAELIQEYADTEALTEYVSQEFGPDWLMYLSEEQLRLSDELLDVALNSVPLGNPRVHFILGVAGTGKTTILVDLAMKILELSDDSNDPKPVLSVPAQVAEQYLKGGLNLSKISRPSQAPLDGLWIIDDPITVGDLQSILRDAFSKDARAVFVGIDPFQWMDASAYVKYQDLLLAIPNKRHYSLNTIYRQRDYVARRAVVRSRKNIHFVEPELQAGDLAKFRLSKETFESMLEAHVIKFGYLGGSYTEGLRCHVPQFLDQYAQELEARTHLWKWTNPCLVVTDYEIVDEQIRKRLLRLGVKFVSYSDSKSVRGVEFQDVIVLLKEGTWSVISARNEGAVGSHFWQLRSQLHTFITRAKDQVQILVHDNHSYRN